MGAKPSVRHLFYDKPSTYKHLLRDARLAMHLRIELENRLGKVIRQP